MLNFTPNRKLPGIFAIFMVLILFGLLYTGCGSNQAFNKDLNSIIKPYTFSILQWELKTIPGEINQFITGYEQIDDEVETVTNYFSLIDRIKALESELKTISYNEPDNRASLEVELTALQEQKVALEDIVERIIEQQLRETLAEQGIYNPRDGNAGIGLTLPPVNFQLETPPYLLVVSPRESIDYSRGITLKQGISLDDIEEIETQVDQLGVSSLVVPLGGLGATYPSFVTNNASLEFTINTAAEEWLHQYLTFKPLGFRYLLHITNISKNYEVVTINETVASMVSDEIGSILCAKYYQECDNNNSNVVDEQEFDFNAEMREIRITVDQHLANGEVALAEEFMEQKRQYLLTQGYYIRKLNQAYFAFYGTYADSPTSISPIGRDLNKLREQSASVKDFLDKAADMTSYQDLIDSIR
ncbi:hypothetical protein ACFLUH_01200 [Chloroflexota bacterium]